MEKITINESDLIINELWWQKRHLMYTATGYGKKIPTHYMVKIGSKKHRIYTCIYSNCGTNYIVKNHKDIIVDII